MNKLILILSSLTLISCSISKTNKINNTNKDNLLDEIEKEKIEITTSCNKGNIQKYLDMGWRITNKNTKSITCSWKYAKSTKNCDVDLDKGCKLTIPDKIGEEILYKLERDIPKSTKSK